MPRPTDADLDKFAEHLMQFQINPIELPQAQHDSSTETKFAPLAADPRFSDLAFAIIQYDPVRIFLHNPDENWDIGSAGKLSIAAGSLSLLKDVRAYVSALGSTPSAARLDDLFRYVWSRHSNARMKRIGTNAHFPLPSKMLDLSASPIHFTGAATINFTALKNKPKRPYPDSQISPAGLATTSFADRLHLTIGKSDNRAARSCQGTVGIGYINSVLETVGLYDVPSGIGVRIAGPYANKFPELPTGWRHPASLRPWGTARIIPSIWWQDIEQRPYVATARNLAGLMMSIMTDKFLDADMSAEFRTLLKIHGGFSYGSYALNGIIGAITAPTPAIESYSKIGVLWSNAEFAHIQIGPLRYSLVILGLVGKGNQNWAERAEALGKEVQLKMAP